MAPRPLSAALPPRRRCARALALLACLFALAGPAQAASPAEVMAAFVFNFVRFTEWPDLPPAAPIQICALDTRGEFAEALALLDGKTAQGRGLRVVAGPRGAELARCQLVWLGSEPRRRLGELAQAGGVAALTVSDDAGALAAGAMIQLAVDNQRVVFDINYEAIARSRLVISSQVLRLARNARDQAPRGRP